MAEVGDRFVGDIFMHSNNTLPLMKVNPKVGRVLQLAEITLIPEMDRIQDMGLPTMKTTGTTFPFIPLQDMLTRRSVCPIEILKGMHGQKK